MLMTVGTRVVITKFDSNIHHAYNGKVASITAVNPNSGMVYTIRFEKGQGYDSSEPFGVYMEEVRSTEPVKPIRTKKTNV